MHQHIFCISRRFISAKAHLAPLTSHVNQLTHVNGEGKISMVNVVQKASTTRIATASGQVFLGNQTFLEVKNNTNKKGDVLTVAKIAGIQAAKQTPNLIPLCHPLLLDHINVDCQLQHGSNSVLVQSSIVMVDKTGCEMEALTAVSVACLTIYDMCKAMNKGIIITNIQLDTKSGGKSGMYNREENNESEASKDSKQPYVLQM
jgi:molybdenum cofactor biosynthesis protein MoaC